MSTYIYGYYNDFETLVIEFKSKHDGHTYVHSIKLDDHPLVNRENAEIWARYFHRKMNDLVNEDAMNSDLFKSIEHEILEEQRRHDEWLAGEPERQRREKHKKELRRTPSLGFIPDGLHTDYAKEYGFYIDSAIQWTPEDNDEFLYQVRSFERMITKCVQRCLEQGRPDAAYAQSSEIFRSLPKWKNREELKHFFAHYQPRLRKLVKATCQAMINSATAWNSKLKLIEINALIESLQNEFIDWGITPRTMLDLRLFAGFVGDPIKIERKPTKQELYEMQQAKRKQEAEERRRAEEEAEKHSIIPLNRFLEDTVFDASHIDWECATIGRMITTVGHEVNNFINRGQMKDALLLFLQIVKSMCRHFVSDEHYDYFDDLYDPEYSCMSIVDDLNKAYEQGKFSQSDMRFFKQAWKEIEQMEACTDYGIANFKFRFPR